MPHFSMDCRVKPGNDEIEKGEELPRIFQNVHALAPAVDQIKPAVFVRANIVRLDARRAGGRLRHVTADFFWA
jgi:hypothetical protein